MDKDFLKEMYAFVKEEGYEDSYGDFVKSMQTDESFRNELYNAVQSEGYEGDSLSFVQSVGGKEQKKLKVPEAFKAFHAETLLPQSGLKRPKNTDRGQMGEYYKEVNADVEKAWQDKANRDAFAVYNKERLLTPTLEQWRSMPFDEKVRSYQQNSGKSMQEAREFITSAPNSAEAEMFDSGMVKGAGSVVKDAFSLPTRGIAGLIGGPEAMATTPETAEGFIPSVLSSPTTLPAIASGGLSNMAGASGTFLSKLPWLSNPLVQKGVEGGLFGLLEGGSKSLRPEGVTSGEVIGDVGMGVFGDVALGGIGQSLAKDAPEAIARGSMAGDVFDNIETLKWADNPQNKALMAQNKGKGLKVGKEIFEDVYNPSMFDEYGVVNSALESMPNIDGTTIVNKMREAIPQNVGEYVADLKEQLAFKTDQIKQIQEMGKLGTLNPSQKRTIGELNQQITDIQGQLSKPVEDITLFQEGGAIETAKKQVKFLADQIEGKQVNPKALRDLRVKMDRYIDFTDDGMDQAHKAVLKDVLYTGRDAMRESLEASAVASGQPQYVEAMRKMAEGFKVRDNLVDVMPKKEKGLESWVGNFEGQNKTAIQEALQGYDAYFGKEFTPKATAVSTAKTLQVNPQTGEPPSQNLWATGGGPAWRGLVNPKTAGRRIKQAEALKDITATPNLGALLGVNAPQVVRDFGGSTTEGLNNLLFGGQSQEDYYDTQSGLK